MKQEYDEPKPIQVNQVLIGQDMADLPKMLHLVVRIATGPFMSIMQHAPETVRRETQRELRELRVELDRWTAALVTPKRGAS